MRRTALLALALLAGSPSVAPAIAAAQADAAAESLARLSYRLPKPPSEMIGDRRAMRQLAAEVDRQTRVLLTQDIITDPAVRRDLLLARRTAALVRGDLNTALRLDRTASDSGRGSVATDMLVAALRRRHDPDVANGERLQRAVRARLDLRGEETRGEMIRLRRENVLASSAYRIGEITGFADPQWQRDPVVPQEFATALLRLWVEINLRNPRLDLFEAELIRWLDRHPSGKTDVWTARELTIDPDKASSVTVAVWDGVDGAVFAGQLRAETGDAPDGLDDDGDGFIDEAEGLAFDENFRPAAGLIMPVPDDLREVLPDLERYKRGLGELMMGGDGPDVAFVRRTRRSLKPEDVPGFERGQSFYANYIHGTEVAAIALRDLPKVELVPVRITFTDATPPSVLDEAGAARFVAMIDTSVRYMRSRGTRVCNISWGFTAADIEDNLRQNGVESDPVIRSRRARAIFATMLDGMTRTLSGSPEILFVVSAGNAGQNIDYAGDLPGTINLPNVLTVGAADEAGNPAYFASDGASVDLYAPGTNVETAVPGGGRLRDSGASLSAPKAVNVAAKLLSVRPELTTSDLASLLVTSATPLPGSRTRLLDGKSALALLRLRQPKN